MISARTAQEARLLEAADKDARFRFDPTPENAPNYSLDKRIAQARREMGEARWAELNKEWEQ